MRPVTIASRAACSSASRSGFMRNFIALSKSQQGSRGPDQAESEMPVQTFKREGAMSLQVLNGPTIAAGESLSDALDCTAGPLVRITIPAEFTPANLTFQLSSDGVGYNDLYDVHGNEITIVARA